MDIENYENDIWPHLYDEYNSHERQKLEFEFCFEELKPLKGPVLEPACGTGMIALELMKRDIDVYGFDVSGQMLDVLFEKAKKLGVKNTEYKFNRQNFTDFSYEIKFDAAYVTARSFLHLLNSDDQIRGLKNIFSHLKPGGKFLINLYTPDLEILLDHAKPNQKFEFYRTLNFKGVEKVDVYMKLEHDLTNQIQLITWRFVFDDSGKSYDSKMAVRWIHRAEFELLLKLAGFSSFELYGGFKKESYKYGSEMVWIAKK